MNNFKQFIYKILLGVFINMTLLMLFVNIPSVHIAFSISVGLSFIFLFVPPLMYFFMIKKYYFNEVFVTFLLQFVALFFFVYVAYPGVSFISQPKFYGVLLYSAISSIIYNLMCYLKK